VDTLGCDWADLWRSRRAAPLDLLLAPANAREPAKGAALASARLRGAIAGSLKP
jgi:hypothetical protein